MWQSFALPALIPSKGNLFWAGLGDQPEARHRSGTGSPFVVHGSTTEGPQLLSSGRAASGECSYGTGSRRGFSSCAAGGEVQDESRWPLQWAALEEQVAGELLCFCNQFHSSTYNHFWFTRFPPIWSSMIGLINGLLDVGAFLVHEIFPLFSPLQGWFLPPASPISIFKWRRT